MCDASGRVGLGDVGTGCIFLSIFSNSCIEGVVQSLVLNHALLTSMDAGVLEPKQSPMNAWTHESWRDGAPMFRGKRAMLCKTCKVGSLPPLQMTRHGLSDGGTSLISAKKELRSPHRSLVQSVQT